jgi:hypothetical protein
MEGHNSVRGAVDAYVLAVKQGRFHVPEHCVA